MEQHLQLLAMGQPILKPVYDHGNGELVRPTLVEPRDLVIVEGLLPLHTKLLRACFDVTVFLAPDESTRREWKIARDTARRGYTREQVIAEMDRREPDAEAFIRPQRREADIVVRLGPPRASLLLRPTIRHPNFADILAEAAPAGVRLILTRDADGTPLDELRIDQHITAAESDIVAKEIWDDLGVAAELPDCLGYVDDVRDEPLRITQLILLHHLIKKMGAP
jgi:phosphoribulokinase